jgi:NAD(P)-dependent dehydrogenase (short-subunit alcohol dehydrogenase family)
VAALLATVLTRHGRLDVVVNAAGIVVADDVATIDDAVWARTLDVNLTGTMRVCRAALPALRAAGGGAIVNVASVAAFNGSAGMASYAASKAGVVALTRALANQYGAERIRANCLCPGWVRTPMSEAEMRAAGAARGLDVEAAFAELHPRIALRRIAAPEELAACALFLASDDASFVTGAVLVADGGARTPATARGI